MSKKEPLASLIDNILSSEEITIQKVKADVKGLKDSFDRLNYIQEIWTFTSLGLDKTGVLRIEKNLEFTLLELHKQASQDARRLAETDGLTELYNRRGIERRMTQTKENYAALMIDIDNFKVINDNFGHIVGDIVIKNVVAIILKNVRESFVGRYGGEEFYVELQLTDKYGGKITGERILKSVEKLAIEYVIQDLKKRSIVTHKKLKKRG